MSKKHLRLKWPKCCEIFSLPCYACFLCKTKRALSVKCCDNNFIITTTLDNLNTLWELVFERNNFCVKSFIVFLTFGSINFCKGTFFKYFMRIKFSEFGQKDILPAVVVVYKDSKAFLSYYKVYIYAHKILTLRMSSKDSKILNFYKN